MKPYARVSEIERRFERALQLISSSHLNARQPAERLDVSLPTAQRMVGELRRRGYVIRSVREDQGWRYELAVSADARLALATAPHREEAPASGQIAETRSP
jgi:DNA-binding IclR family transcriptional regulator